MSVDLGMVCVDLGMVCVDLGIYYTLYLHVHEAKLINEKIGI